MGILSLVAGFLSQSSVSFILFIEDPLHWVYCSWVQLWISDSKLPLWMQISNTMSNCKFMFWNRQMVKDFNLSELTTSCAIVFLNAVKEVVCCIFRFHSSESLMEYWTTMLLTQLVFSNFALHFNFWSFCLQRFSTKPKPAKWSFILVLFCRWRYLKLALWAAVLNQ